MDKKSLWLTLGMIGLIIVPLVIYAVSNQSKAKQGQYDQLARCLTEKGAKMYGAFWCPHCVSQKKDFGSSWQYINYIECSLPDGKTQTGECREAGIDGYPTWEFADGSRIGGQISPEDLAQKTDCEGGE